MGEGDEVPKQKRPPMVVWTNFSRESDEKIAELRASGYEVQVFRMTNVPTESQVRSPGIVPVPADIAYLIPKDIRFLGE